MGEIIFLCLFSLVGGVMFLMTSDFRTSLLDKSGGPGLFPRIIVILLICAVLIRIVQIIVNRETRKPFHFVEMFRGIRLLYILTTLAYMLLVPYLGYLLSTIAYTLFSVLYYRRREVSEKLRPLMVGLVAGLNAVLVVGLYFFFTQIVNIRLPAGLLGA